MTGRGTVKRRLGIARFSAAHPVPAGQPKRRDPDPLEGWCESCCSPPPGCREAKPEPIHQGPGADSAGRPGNAAEDRTKPSTAPGDTSRLRSRPSARREPDANLDLPDLFPAVRATLDVQRVLREMPALVAQQNSTNKRQSLLARRRSPQTVADCRRATRSPSDLDRRGQVRRCHWGNNPRNSVRACRPTRSPPGHTAGRHQSVAILVAICQPLAEVSASCRPTRNVLVRRDRTRRLAPSMRPGAGSRPRSPVNCLPPPRRREPAVPAGDPVVRWPERAPHDHREQSSSLPAGPDSAGRARSH